MSQSQGWSNWQDSVESDEEDLEEAEYADSSKEALLFAIECTDSMLAPRIKADGSGAESTLATTLQCALDLMKLKVIIARKDMVGIILFNCEEHKGAATTEGLGSSDHIYVVQDLEPLSADGIQSLKKVLADAKKDPDGFAHRFRHKTSEKPSVLPEAIRFSAAMLKDKASNAACRIFFITDEDDPFPSDSPSGKQLRDVTKTNVSDMSEMKTTMLPFFISRPQKEQHFDTSKFYNELFAMMGMDLEDSSGYQSFHLTESDKMYDELKAQFSVRQSVKRAQFTIPFVLGDGLAIGVQGFSFVTETKKGAAIQVDTSGRDVREVKQILTYDDKDQARPLNPKTEMMPYFTMGGKGASVAQKIVYTDEEVKLLKNLGMVPGLYLLGFTQLKRFKPEEQLKHAYFVYPHEEAVRAAGKSFVGSKRVFTSLLQTLLEKDKIGLGVLLARANSTPIHVLIVPQAEKTENDDPMGKQIEPPGFHLIQLAFADDLRAVNVDSSIPCATDDDEMSVGNRAIVQMKKVLQKLKQKFNPDNYPNPALNYHYDCLQAIALKEDLPVVQDKTAPLYHEIKRRTGDLMIEFKSIIAEHPETEAGKNVEQVDAKKKKASAKRKRSSSDEEGPEEPEEVDATEGTEYVEAKFESGTEKKLKVDELKAYCRIKKLKLTGKKDDLIERIRGTLESQTKVEEDDE